MDDVNVQVSKPRRAAVRGSEKMVFPPACSVKIFFQILAARLQEAMAARLAATFLSKIFEELFGGWT